jgi:hypothetical protein
MYMQYGNRGVDKFFQAQHALSQKPDMLIYGVNPTFDFATINIIGEHMTPGSLATFGDLAAWRWALALSTPGEIVQGVFMRLLPGVRDRYDMGAIIARIRDKLDWFGFGALRPAPVDRSFNPLWAKGLPPYDPKRVPGSQVVELMALERMNISDDSWGARLLDDFVARARRSGIPTLIYVLPLNLRAIEGNPVALKNFLLFEKWFRDFAKRETRDAVYVIPQTPSRKLSGLEFFDVDHLTVADPFIEYMRQEISEHARIRR